MKELSRRQVSAVFDAELYAELEQTARERRLSLADVIRQSVLAHIADQRRTPAPDKAVT